MITVTEFEAEFTEKFPELCQILKRGPLVIHEGIAKITLHGSRGPAGGFSDDSDIDLCMLVDNIQYSDIRHDEELIKEMLFTPLAEWREKIKLDVRIIFDLRKCGLPCFNEPEYNPHLCVGGGIDCFGIYEKENGDSRYVYNCLMNVKLIYPYITVWRNPRLAY